MTAAGVPCTPGYHGPSQEPKFLLEQATEVGFPVLLKAVKGGGGKGMRISQSPEDFYDQLKSAKSEASSSCGDDTMLLEKYITTPRHIEVQIFADKHGNCVALGERDCSLQRRHQKIIEESPAPNLDHAVREDLWEKARAAALAVKYEGAGTVEFIFDTATDQFYFMEMNTRLQVEHPVTEMVTGQDLVHWQLQVAEGKELPMTQVQIGQKISELGHAIEARIYAENTAMDFVPDAGIIRHLRQPQQSEDLRIDAGFIEGDEVSAHYDPMIAKLIVRGTDRTSAIRKLNAALERYEIVGLTTNIGFLRNICQSHDFVSGLIETSYIEKHKQELFHQQSIPPEAYAQAALGVVLQEQLQLHPTPGLQPLSGMLNGLTHDFQPRTILLTANEDKNEADADSSRVTITRLSPTRFDVSVGERCFSNVTAHLRGARSIDVHFPHTRITSTIVRDAQYVTVFDRGAQYRFRLLAPPWAEKVLGTVLAANSVVAPMPCKVLRVDVVAGQTVEKNQSLVVIESMKMETTIRSPQDGTISRIVHSKGDMCKAGTALVEFE
ncbi:MAG: hypothetical protein M1828_000266 [Chrysothrix sp. TS-e1954]|nr:MAG: hypothetical protein M1828_000266 [Chrysothrix sp. TS-e1954]